MLRDKGGGGAAARGADGGHPILGTVLSTEGLGLSNTLGAPKSD